MTVASAPPRIPKVAVKIAAPKVPSSVGTYVSSATFNFTGTVTLDGASASCASWPETLSARPDPTRRLAALLKLGLSTYTVMATYTNGAVTVYLLVIG